MTDVPLFYKRVAPLNRERHRDWFMEPVGGYQFATQSNSVYVAAVEFPRVAREYPILFAAGAGDAVVPVALLGLRNRQNLFVGPDGAWRAEYVPAYVRRYPFILAHEKGSGQYTVCIDEEHAGFNREGRGERLIEESSPEGSLLARSTAFLQDYQTQVEHTEAFCAEVAALGLLEPMQANIELASGEKFALGGFRCVRREALRALEPGKLHALAANDSLELVYAHLLSLGNLQRLIDRMTA